MATTYRIQFNNVEEQAIECTLTDETGDLDIIDIEGAEDAIRIVSQDNDESKYSPIKAKKCVIKFLNSQSVNVRTFSTGEDNRWLVTVKINSLTVFVGHLEQGDIEEPFQYEENQIVTLTATDGLGVLKTHRLEDVYNVWTPGNTQENRIIDYIAACLGVTGLRLTINIINNLREQDNDDISDTSTFGSIYATLYLNIKTWEDQKVGQYLNCYDILERILGHDCYLTQAKGQWWIIRVKELRCDFNMTKTIFDSDGTVLDFETLNYEHSIGLKDINNTTLPTPDAVAFFSQDKTILSLQRPVKYVALNYKFDNPFETICNETFERGDFIADLSDEVDEDGFTLQAKSYNADCWTYQKGVPITTQDSDVYIKRLFQNGQEKQRFIHFPEAATNAFYYLVNDGLIPVGLNDKFTFSFNVRYNTDFGSLSGDFQHLEAWVRLYADDGTFWSAHGVSGTQTSSDPPGNYWVETASDWLGATSFNQEGEASAIDFTQWQSLSFDSAPIPRSGKLEIILINQDVTDTRTKDFSSINFEYIPYINGNYNTFSSQTDTSTRDGSYFGAIEDEVFISNSPRPIFKGALLKFNGTDYVIVDKFYEGQEYDQTTGPDHLATYGELRVRAYHQQFRNGDEIYRLTAQGLGEGVQDPNTLDDHPDIIHRYFNRDIEPTTNNQGFQLVSQDVDLRNCEWTGTLIKNFDIGIGFVSDTYTFSYGAPGGSTGSGSGGGVGITSAVITADNGLHIDPANNVRLGGSLVENTSIDVTDVLALTITGNNGTANGTLIVNNTDDDTGVGIYGSGPSIGVKGVVTAIGIGVYGDGGSDGSSIGVAGVSENYFALAGVSNNGGALYAQILPVSTTGVAQIAVFLRSSQGTPTNGIAGSVDFQLQFDAGTTITSGRIITTLTDVSARTSTLEFKCLLSNAESTILTLNGDKSIQLTPITSTEASAITPAEGMMLFVSNTNGTFTAVGLWCYENGAWSKK